MAAAGRKAHQPSYLCACWSTRPKLTNAAEMNRQAPHPSLSKSVEISAANKTLVSLSADTLQATCPMLTSQCVGCARIAFDICAA